jgi:hypothetical protein
MTRVLLLTAAGIGLAPFGLAGSAFLIGFALQFFRFAP